MARSTLRLAIAFALGSTAAAAPGCDAHELAPANASPDQQRAYEELATDTQKEWTWLQDADRRTPLHLSAERTGAPVLLKGQAPAAATRSFLKRYRGLYKMTDPDSELVETKTVVDELSMTHVRFQQTTRGIPVSGGGVYAHFDRAGHLASIDASYVAGLDAVDVTPRIDPAARLDELVRDVIASAKLSADDVKPTGPARLVVHTPKTGSARLAYEATIRAVAGEHPAVWVMTVDAITGELLHKTNALRHVTATGRGVLGETLQMEVSQGLSGFEMLDRTHPVTVRTQTARNVESTDAGRLVQSPSLTSWDTQGTGAGSAVSAHAFTAQVANYYATRLGWNGQDGRGSPFIVTVHYGVDYDNAFWDSNTGGGVFFGDGNDLFRPAAVDSDVVAHEITHGVTENASRLGFEGEQGALHESLSDIFAAFFKHSLGIEDNLVWIFSPHWDRNLDFIRDMRQPARDGFSPDHMSKFISPQSDPDDGGVHGNAGIPNNAAFLMTMGGQNPTSGTPVAFGLGYEKSEKLWWRTLTTYVHETTTYAQLAASMQQAATDIQLTQNEKNIVDCAWKAVGVVSGACAAITDPAPPPAPSTDTTKPKSKSAGDDDDDDDDDSSSKKKKKARGAVDPNATAGCSATPASPPTGSSAAFGLAVLGVVGVLAARRRRAH